MCVYTHIKYIHLNILIYNANKAKKKDGDRNIYRSFSFTFDYIISVK